MRNRLRIALDAMGGDHGPSVVIPGADIAIERRPDIAYLLVGREQELRPWLDKYPRVAENSIVQHADYVVRMDDKPSQALRQGRWKSSMWIALEAVKKGQAEVCVSAGNTGALMAMSRFALRTMAKIDRPVIAGIWPNVKGESIVLDVGASIGADAQQLVDMAVMGSAMARIVFDIKRPTVGLLNVGVEEIKGVEEVKAAGKILREANLPSLSYHGFVEGDDIGKGTVDVVVTEGFAGNIALKTAEGTARQIGEYLRSAMTRSWRSKLGYIFAKDAFDALKRKMDPRRVNGGVFLGLSGIVIKSHGGTDPLGFAAAIELGYDMVKHDLQAKISESLDQYYGAPRGGTEFSLERTVALKDEAG